MVGGDVVSKEGHLVGIDEEKLAYEGEKVCTNVLRNHCDAF
jgi:hydroxyatrazine ethylaminohydrolase